MSEENQTTVKRTRTASIVNHIASLDVGESYIMNREITGQRVGTSSIDAALTKEKADMANVIGATISRAKKLNGGTFRSERGVYVTESGRMFATIIVTRETDDL
jgi:hypothetical protein